MGSQQQFCLRWNNHQSNMLVVFDQLLQSESFVDVTLACEGLSLKAHKMVLSACSPYFQSLFMDNPCQHPIVILKDMHYNELKAIVDFMYKGEVNVSQDQLPALLKTAETLKVKGLAEVTGATNGVSEESPSLSHASNEPATPTLRPLIPINPSSASLESRGILQQDGRISPPSKRKRGRPRRRSNSDGGHDNLEVLESLVDMPQEDTLSPLPSLQSSAPPSITAKDTQNDELEDGQSEVIISDEKSPQDEDDEGLQEDLVPCDIKMEVPTPEVQPMCLEDPSQLSSLTPIPGTSSASQDGADYVRNCPRACKTRVKRPRRLWSDTQMEVAVDAVRNGQMSITLAATIFGIPRMTLWKRTQRLGVSSSFRRRGGKKPNSSTGEKFVKSENVVLDLSSPSVECSSSSAVTSTGSADLADSLECRSEDSVLDLSCPASSNSPSSSSGIRYSAFVEIHDTKSGDDSMGMNAEVKEPFFQSFYPSKPRDKW